jgi:hypothetical protein
MTPSQNNEIKCRLGPTLFLLLLLLTFLFTLSSAARLDFESLPVKSVGLNHEDCRCLLADKCWPNTREWNNFNITLDGKLLAMTPIGSVCHLISYNENEYTKLRSGWNSAETHISSPSSIMASFFANYSCDPFTPKESPCDIGTYVSYTVNATSASDYQKTIDFARRNNIRITIRNTGHDYYRKSTGVGAIALWTHHLKDIEIIDYESMTYSGKAIKVGAGVSVIEATIAAHSLGLVVVRANDKTVGFARGYTQGGGHGQLVSRFGLAADQVLE